jgi:hypothetical protein
MTTESALLIYHLDFPIGSIFRIIHQLVISPLHYTNINRPTTVIKLSTRKIWIIFKSVLDVRSLLTMVYYLSAENLIPSHQTINYSLMLQWFCPYEMTCHRYQTTTASRDMESYIWDKIVTKESNQWLIYWSPVNQVDLYESTLISTTGSFSGANGTYDSYVLSGAGYSPFNIWQNNSVAEHYIFGTNNVESN